jgi:Fe-S-cluster containining protein
MTEPYKLPQFERLTCDCADCMVPCVASPGGLVPDDLDAIVPKCPDGSLDYEWCEKHFLLSFDTTLVNTRTGDSVRVPVIIPGFQIKIEGPNQHPNMGCVCVFLDDLASCRIHSHSPFGCRMFTMHMDPEEATKRSQAMVNAIIADWQAGGPYHQLCLHLARKERLAPPKDDRMEFAEIFAEEMLGELRRVAESN